MDKTIQAVQKPEKLERDFYNSLSRLSAHYGIVPFETKQFPYPYNMALSIWDTKTQLKDKVSSFDDLQFIQEKNRSLLTTEERCKTGSTLFYIPVTPLYLMLKDKQRRKTALLFSAVYSYLYHVADIPYFRQEGSYLFWQYEMMEDWVEMDEEDDYTQSSRSEIRKAEFTGDAIEQKIFNIKTLHEFEKRLKSFICKDDYDEECLKMATQVFALYSQYPQESIFRNSKVPLDAPYDDNETIQMEKYISFWADSDGWLCDTITDGINNEFNEYGDIDEPSIIKRFDGTSLDSNNLNFETRLFELLDELIYLLNAYKKQKNGN